jgi:uncharacterized protein YdeI (YjbR/CyaY-like superfamily)
VSTRAELPVLRCRSGADWARWLAGHHADSPGVWLEIARAGGEQSVSYARALEEALCWGWIDGQKARGPEGWWRQRFTPRRPRGRWSKINCEKAEALIAAGVMQPPGIREVERARSDGRWDAAYEGQRTATVPEDLERALAHNERARAFFATLDAVNRYAIIYRIGDARRPDTRARRVAKYVAMLAEGRKIHSRDA